MSGSFESERWNACAHRLNLALYFHPKKCLGNLSRTIVNSKGKFPSTGGSGEGRTCDAASRRTASSTHYQLSYSSFKSLHGMTRLGKSRVRSRGRRFTTRSPRQSNSQVLHTEPLVVRHAAISQCKLMWQAH